ncbi:MAG: NAD-dependent epimerase/dehydratase family protein [Acidimicrobiales bacterium]|nr:NAD-dependent epimerase/dehydratase family protein [Acidimicrobiales bacterium]
MASPKVLVTGSSGSVGNRVTPLLAEDFSVLAVDRELPVTVPAGVESKQLDLLVDDLTAVMQGVEVVVHLATALSADGWNHDGRIDLGIARRVLEAAGRAGVQHVVLVSTAMVYGAWADNPIPLTEDAPLRPDHAFSFAIHKAELERMAMDYRVDHPGRTVTVLRPAITVAEEQPGGLARILHSAMTVKSEEGDPPAQFLHADDLATAIVTAVGQRVDGVLNVAPDGWIPADDLVALAGPKPRVRVPGWAATIVSALRFRTGLAPTPPGIVPYTEHPWVVANDRLRELGWEPTNSNEEAYVAGHQPGRFDMLTAKQRQTLSLGAVGVVAAAIGGLVWWLWRRHRS